MCTNKDSCEHSVGHQGENARRMVVSVSPTWEPALQKEEHQSELKRFRYQNADMSTRQSRTWSGLGLGCLATVLESIDTEYGDRP